MSSSSSSRRERFAVIHNAIIRQSFRSRRGLFSCPLAVASFENAFQKPRVDGTAGARRTEGRKTRRKSRSFVTPERRRRAVRDETRGFECVKNTFIRRASSHRRARRRRASNPSRVPSSSAFPRKDEARSAIAIANRIVVVVAVPVVLPDTDARVRRAQINANGGSVSLTHVCVRVCRHKECAS